VLERRATEVTGATWWNAGSVVVRSARVDAESSSARAGARGVEIRLADAQCTLTTLAHELAHALAGVGHGHDERFRRAHVDVVTALAGLEPGEWLAAAYDDLGLAVGTRAWPDPGGGVIAL
jgi:hypothetical protein